MNSSGYVYHHFEAKEILLTGYKVWEHFYDFLKKYFDFNKYVLEGLRTDVYMTYSNIWIPIQIYSYHK